MKLFSRSFALFIFSVISMVGAQPKESAEPTGTWTWVTQGRNGQPEETTLKLDTAKDGTVSGTITDRAGTRPISNAMLVNGRLEFKDVRETPSGKLEATFSGKVEGETLKGSFERSDRALGERSAAKKRKIDWNATRVPTAPTSPAAEPKS